MRLATFLSGAGNDPSLQAADLPGLLPPAHPAAERASYKKAADLLGQDVRPAFREFLPENRESPILNVGCGSGALVWWLHSRGYANAAGIDLSQDQIAAGHALEIVNLFNEGLAEHLERCASRYSLIFLRDVIEHIAPDELLDFMDLVHSALGSEGRMVLQTPNASSPFFGRVLYGDFSHEHAFTASSLSQIPLLSGFEGLCSNPSSPACRGFSGNASFRPAAGGIYIGCWHGRS